MFFIGGEENSNVVALIVDSESARGKVSGSMQHMWGDLRAWPQPQTPLCLLTPLLPNRAT